MLGWEVHGKVTVMQNGDYDPLPQVFLRRKRNPREYLHPSLAGAQVNPVLLTPLLSQAVKGAILGLSGISYESFVTPQSLEIS